MIFSASAAPRVAVCPASVALPQVSVTRPGMRLGSAVHGFLESLNRGTSKADALAALDGDAAALCAQIDPTRVPIGVPEIAYAYDVATGRAWRLTVDGHRGYGVTSDTVIPGTIDLLVEGRLATATDPGQRWIVVDWSTDHDLDVAAKRQQVETYMLMVARAHNVATVDGAIGTFRLSGELAWHTWSLDAWGLIDVATRLKDAHAAAVRARNARREHEINHAAPWSPDVTRGPHCRDCRAFMSCPATAAMVRAVGVPEASLGVAYEVAQTSEKWGKEVRDHARAAVERDGFVPMPGDRRLVKRTDKNNRTSLRVIRAQG